MSQSEFINETAKAYREGNEEKILKIVNRYFGGIYDGS